MASYGDSPSRNKENRLHYKHTVLNQCSSENSITEENVSGLFSIDNSNTQQENYLFC